MKTKVKETLFDDEYWEDICEHAQNYSWTFGVGELTYYISPEGFDETTIFFIDCENDETGEEYPRVYFKTVKEMLEEYKLHNGQTIKDFCINGYQGKRQH